MLGLSAALPARAQEKVLNVFNWNDYIAKDTLEKFTSETGIKVNFNMQAFPVYNQRADLELSTKGSAYDVVNVTFIYSSRWIDSGWLTSLDDRPSCAIFC